MTETRYCDLGFEFRSPRLLETNGPLKPQASSLVTTTSGIDIFVKVAKRPPMDENAYLRMDNFSVLKWYFCSVSHTSCLLLLLHVVASSIPFRLVFVVE